MRTLYIEPGSAVERAFPNKCVVIDMTPLMRELVLCAVRLDVTEATANERLARLVGVLIDEARTLSVMSLYLPMPSDRRAAKVCDAFLANPANDLTLDEWGKQIGTSSRTLARLFTTGTGMTFAQWRQ